MMRWKRILGLALFIAAAGGCRQEVFLHESTMQESVAAMGLPASLESNPDFEPPSTRVPKPTDVEDVTRNPYYLSLPEAIAQALEHGTTGIQSTRLTLTASGSPTALSISNDDLLTFQGSPLLLTGSDTIRVLALDAAVNGADIDVSLAKFDALWRTSLTFSATDQPIQGLNSFQNGNFSSFISEIIKPLPSGGTVGVAFTTQYQNLTTPTAGITLTNPAYQTGFNITYDQPLLLAFGVDINELRQTHPNSASTATDLQRQPTLSNIGNDINGAPPEGILITRVRFDQSRAEFERAVDFMVANVEVAYWALYDSYLQLYASEQGMRLAHTVWRLTKLAFDAGKISAKDYYPQVGQFEQFRGDRVQALAVVLERERQLRALMGLPVEDGKRLIPIDTPTLAQFKPDWTSALNDALSLRPELIISRHDLKVRQLRLMRAKNDLLPDLRFTSSYGISGLGTSLTGNTLLPSGLTDNAFRSLSSDHFNNWSAGLTLNVPIGFRAAYATLRQARLQLAQGWYQLHDQEDKAVRFLTEVYRSISTNYDTIQARRSQRLAYGEQLKAKLQEIDVGKSLPDLQLLDALRQWTAALQQEFDAIANYNISLVGFEFAKGTVLKHDSVVISEGPLPACAQVRAVEHERQRARAIVLRERADPRAQTSAAIANGKLCVPEVLDGTAPPLPALLPASSDMEPIPGGLDAPKMASENIWKTAPTTRAGSLSPDTTLPSFTPSPSGTTPAAKTMLPAGIITPPASSSAIAPTNVPAEHNGTLGTNQPEDGREVLPSTGYVIRPGI